MGSVEEGGPSTSGYILDTSLGLSILVMVLYSTKRECLLALLDGLLEHLIELNRPLLAW
jgi:hypothetical protein